MKKYDAIIIGTGGGAKIASSLLKLGKKIAVIEDSKPGGTCLNRGCIPSKMLIHPSHIAEDLNRLSDFNITNNNFKLQIQDLTKRINEYTDGVSDSISSFYTNNENVDFYKGVGSFSSNNIVSVLDQTLTAPLIFIATGSRARIPNIKGLYHCPFITATEALKAKKIPKKITIIGGGFIAFELGSAYSAFGSEVTFLIRSKGVKSLDSEVRDHYYEAIKDKFRIIENVNFEEIEYVEKEFIVNFHQDNIKQSIKSDSLLIAAGIIPNSDNLNLGSTDIKVSSSGFITVNDFLETDVAGVYALGDVVGNFLFRHSVNFEAEYLIKSLYIKDKIEAIKYPPMPEAVFTSPEISSVGLTEQEAIKHNIDYYIGRGYFTKSAMGKARVLKDGLVKLIFNSKTDVLIGAHIVGSESSTLIHQLVLAISNNLTIFNLYDDMIYIHPALNEIVRDAVRSALKNQHPQYKLLF